MLDYAEPDARLVFSCGWHITRDGQDHYSRRFWAALRVAAWLGRLVRAVEIDDQWEACRRIFASDRRRTVVRGSDLEEGESQGLPVWSRHVGAPILASNLTRRVDFALFVTEALTDDTLVQEAPAIVGCGSASALAHAGRNGPRAWRGRDRRPPGVGSVGAGLPSGCARSSTSFASTSRPGTPTGPSADRVDRAAVAGRGLASDPMAVGSAP